MLGTVTGLALGTVVSLGLIASINRLSQATVTPSLPWVELVGVLLAGVVLGFLAALHPSTPLDPPRRPRRDPVHLALWPMEPPRVAFGGARRAEVWGSA